MLGDICFLNITINIRKLFDFCNFGVFVALLLLKLLSFSGFGVVLVCLLWGLSIVMFGLAFQAKVLHLVPVGTSVAMSIFLEFIMLESEVVLILAD